MNKLSDLEIRSKWKEICSNRTGDIIDSGLFAIELVRWSEQMHSIDEAYLPCGHLRVYESIRISDGQTVCGICGCLIKPPQEVNEE